MHHDGVAVNIGEAAGAGAVAASAAQHPFADSSCFLRVARNCHQEMLTDLASPWYAGPVGDPDGRVRVRVRVRNLPADFEYSKYIVLFDALIPNILAVF
jgi:hypothetical protein